MEQAKSTLSIPLPESRVVLEARVGAAVARLDAMDGDPDFEEGNDIEVVCEDEGADEGGDDCSTPNCADSCSPIRFGHNRGKFQFRRVPAFNTDNKLQSDRWTMGRRS